MFENKVLTIIFDPKGVEDIFRHTVSEAVKLHEYFSKAFLCRLRNCHLQRSDNSVARLGR